MSKPAISVVVAGKEGDEILSAALESIRSQTFRDCQLVVADVQESLAVARNSALEKCNGDYVAFLDSDQVWAPDKLAKQVVLLAGHPELNWCYCASDASLPSADILRPLLLKNFIPSGSVMVRRSVIFDADGFDESPEFRLSEEWELWLRLAATHPVALIAENLVYSSQEEHGGNDLRLLSNKRVVEAAVARHPDLLLDLRSEALAEICIAAGNAYLMADRREEARLNFAEALTHSPLRSDAYLCWISSFLPSETQRQIRDLNNLSRHLQGSEKYKDQPLTRR